MGGRAAPRLALGHRLVTGAHSPGGGASALQCNACPCDIALIAPGRACLAQVEEVPLAGLFHQQHYSNFYHMLSEVAPSVHYTMCKYLGDCAYSPDSK